MNEEDIYESINSRALGCTGYGFRTISHFSMTTLYGRGGGYGFFSSSRKFRFLLYIILV